MTRREDVPGTFGGTSPINHAASRRPVPTQRGDHVRPVDRGLHVPTLSADLPLAMIHRSVGEPQDSACRTPTEAAYVCLCA